MTTEKSHTTGIADQSVMRTDQTIKVKVASTGISLSAGAATAYVLVVPSY